MPAPAAVIQGALVDAKNVAAHKCVRLSIDVPAELGTLIVEAFGWPTMADPVTVAVARLKPEAVQETAPASALKAKREFRELPAPTQAALTCKEPRFWAYLREDRNHECQGEEEAADYVRTLCQVDSRSELMPGSKAAHRWSLLATAFKAWEEAEKVGA